MFNPVVSRSAIPLQEDVGNTRLFPLDEKKIRKERQGTGQGSRRIAAVEMSLESRVSESNDGSVFV